jgi:hypothetical protein
MIQAEDFSARQGGVFDPPRDKEPRLGILALANGNWVRFDSVNFMNGEYDSISLYVWTGNPHNPSGATLRARLDSPTGTVVATITNLPNILPYGYGPSAPASGPLSAVTGFHSLVITFEGSSSICDFDKVRLAGVMTTGPNDAQTYYVATGGSDGNDGLATDRPFKTIQRAALVMRPGSVCRIRGGIYRETVKPACTGLAGAPLAFEAYNNENVVISGADPVTGWTIHSGSIYKAPMKWTMGATNDQVLVDGKMAWVARAPNVDEAYNPHPYLNWCGTGIYNWKPWQNELEPVAIPTLVCMGDNGSLWSGDQPVGAPFDMAIDQNTDATYRLPSALFGKPADFFKGGLITLRNYYYAGVGQITGSTSTSTKTVINGTKTECQWKDWGGPGFVSYVFGLLDAPNEWYRQDSTLYLWAPGGGDPSSRLVEAKKRTLGFDFRGKQYVNITGIRLIAASMTLEDASNCIITRCHFKYVSHYDNYNPLNTGAGFFGTPFDPSDGTFGIFVSGNNNLIENSSVIGSAGSGIILNGKFNTVNNCRIHSCNYMANYQAGILFIRRDLTDKQDGLGNVASHNSIKGCSRGGIQIGQAAPPTGATDRTRIEYNDFDLCAYASNETGSLAGQGAPGVDVSHNWFHGVEGPQNGDIAQEYDFGARGWIVHHNVYWQGTPLIQGGFTVSFHWWFDHGDAESKCFNNTVISKIVGGHADIDTNWPGFSDGWAAHNIIYARGDTATWKFTDAKNNDYTLRAGSPAIDAGTVIPGWVETYNGSKPDLGAYEFGQARWVAGADWPEAPWVYPPSENQSVAGPGPLLRTDLAIMKVMPGRLLIGVPGAIAWQSAVYDTRGARTAHHAQPDGGLAYLSTRSMPAGIYAVKVSCAGKEMCWKVLVRK